MGTTEGHDPGAHSRRAAHDLLQSIVIIQALVGAEKAAVVSGSALEQRLVLIEQEARTMAALCDRVLGTDPMAVELDLASVAARVVERARCTYTGRVELDAALAVIEGDPLEWERCVFNLAANACRAAGDDGRVQVRVWATDGTCRISVGDSGPGFGRAVTGRASLGMVTVADVIERHGGHLEVGQSPLGGAELTVVVPPED